MTERQHWPSKWIFILAAVGSAAGIGNLWRFPNLAFEHGGAAFLLVIILANVLVGIPLLIAEVGIGQMMQKGAPDAFKQIKKGFTIIGWMMVIFAFYVITYYVAVMGWGLDYIYHSFTLPQWAAQAESFFFNDVLNISAEVGAFNGFSKPVLIGVVLAWLAIYFTIWKGVKSVSKVVVWTATLPFALLAILIIRAVTLDGAGEGLQLFFIPDWTALKDPQLWIAAFSQVFFSLSLAFGVMLAYGSYQPEKAELSKSVVIVAIGNFLVSLMSGIVVFATLGYMATQQGVAVADVFTKSSVGLAFVVFPQAIALLPALVVLFSLIFFGNFFLLALDSAFSLIEGFAAPFKDRFSRISTKKITLWIVIVGFAIGLLYTTKPGIIYLDITDHFIVFYGITTMGLLLALVVGWFWKGNQLRDFINEHSKWKLGTLWDIAVKIIAPLFLIALLILNIREEFKLIHPDPDTGQLVGYEGYPLWALFAFGIIPVLLVPVIAIILDKMTKGKSTEPGTHVTTEVPSQQQPQSESSAEELPPDQPTTPTEG